MRRTHIGELNSRAVGGRQFVGRDQLTARTAAIALGLVAGFALVSALFAAFVGVDQGVQDNPYIFSYLGQEYTCTIAVDRRQLGPLAPLSGQSGRSLEWISQPRGRPLAVYAEVQGLFRACFAPAVNLRRTPLGLRQVSRGDSITAMATGVHETGCHLQATVEVAGAKPATSLRVPLALLRCGLREMMVHLVTHAGPRSSVTARFRLGSQGRVPACVGHTQLVEFRIETPSSYFLSPPHSIT